jgi:hypothetical protein
MRTLSPPRPRNAPTELAGSAIAWVRVPHYSLNEAEFNVLVDPPAYSHQWLPTIRGAWLASLVLGGGPLVGALCRGRPITMALIPDVAWFGFIGASAALMVLEIYVRSKKDRRKDLISRIRRTWEPR